MKKLFILGTFLLSTPLWAQYYTQNARTLSDLQSSAVNIAPGVSIVPPAWTRALNNNTVNNPNNPNNANNGAIPTLNENTRTVTIASDPKVQQQVQKNADDIRNAQDSQKAQQPTQQVNTLPTAPLVVKPAPKPAVIASSISDWNKTTQKEIEEKAQDDLQQKYKAFLMNR